MNLIKLEVRNEKYLKDIEGFSSKKKEVELSLSQHLDERAKLQRELVRNKFRFGMFLELITFFGRKTATTSTA